MFVLLATLWMASTPPAVKVPNQCVSSKDSLVIHVLIQTQYQTKDAKQTRSSSEDLWQIHCDRKTRACQGVSLDVDRLKQTGEITLMSLNSLRGAEIVSSTGSVTVIRWGPLRTFVVDFEKGEVSYLESSTTSEGRGVAKCGR